MRVYLPFTLPGLAELLASAEIGQPPRRGFAVTPALREWYVSGDLEELEYAAMMLAARASLRLLLEDPDAPPRRVVLAVEIQPVILAVPVTPAVQGAAQRELGLGVGAPVGAHVGRAACAGRVRVVGHGAQR